MSSEKSDLGEERGASSAGIQVVLAWVAMQCTLERPDTLGDQGGGCGDETPDRKWQRLRRDLAARLINPFKGRIHEGL